MTTTIPEANFTDFKSLEAVGDTGLYRVQQELDKGFGLFDPRKKQLIIPCQFGKTFDPSCGDRLWKVTDEKNTLNGVYNVAQQELAAPLIHNQLVDVAEDYVTGRVTYAGPSYCTLMYTRGHTFVFGTADFWDCGFGKEVREFRGRTPLLFRPPNYFSQVDPKVIEIVRDIVFVQWEEAIEPHAGQSRFRLAVSIIDFHTGELLKKW